MFAAPEGTTGVLPGTAGLLLTGIVMTQQEFTEKLEAAHSWMQAVQERLKVIDNTQGPLDALKIRLQESENIHHSQHEGLEKIDAVMAAAESLLQNGNEDLRNQTNAQLKEIKNDWEETSTYIVHCHSRIEWVYLHWSEYLKAHEEFEQWLIKTQRIINVGPEMQLGVKEKLWQVDLHRVLMSDIHGQETLLERLLDEGAALYNQTQDSSVEPESQEKLQEAYNDIRDRAKETVGLLHKIAEDHETFQGCVLRFQSWLLSKTKELTHLMEKDDTPELKLQALQLLDGHVANEEKTLQHIESLVETVRAKTSPAGAEIVLEEAEELRLGWQRLRQGLCEAEDGLRMRLDSHGQYVTRCQRLGEDLGRLRVLLQGLDQELEKGEVDKGGCSEKQLLDQWTKYVSLRNTLADEECRVEQVKSQLKDLLQFSENSRRLSEDVLAVVKEHQSVKSKATRLCSESESGLRHSLQDPLLVYNKWSDMVSQVLEASAEEKDFSSIATCVRKIECLLKDGEQIKGRLDQVQGMENLLKSILGHERSETFQAELACASRNRDLLYSQLMQRRSRLQGLLSRTKDFDGTYQLIQAKLTDVQDRLVSAEGLQPDLLAKKSQSNQYRTIQTELDDCEAHINVLETLISSRQDKSQLEKLRNNFMQLCNMLKVQLRKSDECVTEHESFHENLLNFEKWLKIYSQKIRSFISPSGQWSVEGREQEAQKILQELPEKELEIQELEVKGEHVLQKTSDEGRVHITKDLKRLRESWLELYNISSILHRLFGSTTQATGPDSLMIEGLSEASAVFGRPVEGENILFKDEFTGNLLDQKDLDAVDCSEGKMKGNLQVFTVPPEESLTLAGRKAVYRNRSNIEEVVASSFLTADVGADYQSEQIHDGDSDIESKRNISAQVGMTIKGSIEGQDKVVGQEQIVSQVDYGLSGLGTTFNRSKISKSDTKGSRRMKFEAWLLQENELLSDVLNQRSQESPNSEQLKKQQQTLEALNGRLGWGQEQFQLLLQTSDDAQNATELEDLRYHWMLYKSKLRAAGNFQAKLVAKKGPAEKENFEERMQKSPSFMQRVCRCAVPLWLFLLTLLLLAFLLPLVDEGSSCSLSNNFARSFNIMLRYEGPPPT